MATFNNSSTIIASRFAEGLNNLNYPVYQIKSIDYGFIEKQLNILNFQLPDQFRREIINLLQKPLFYRLYQEQKITLSTDMTPVDIYKSFVGRISSELNYSLNVDVPLDRLLKPLAYEILNNGIETFNLNDLEVVFTEFFLKNSPVETSPNDVINWLISRNFIIPSSKLRLSFFHQSIAEYLAALELAEKYKANPDILNEILKFKRWDQCLFLTLSFLNESDTDSFIQKIIKIDMLLAIKAAKYLEYNSDSVFLQILVDLQNTSATEFSWSRALSEFPATKHHEEALLQLLKKKDDLGGVAARLLQKAIGNDIKDVLIKELFENPTDYNYCGDLGVSLGNILHFGEFQSLFERAEAITLEEEDWK